MLWDVKSLYALGRPVATDDRDPVLKGKGVGLSTLRTEKPRDIVAFRQARVSDLKDALGLYVFLSRSQLDFSLCQLLCFLTELFSWVKIPLGPPGLYSPPHFLQQCK